MAEDYTAKRRDIASKSVEATTNLIKGIQYLLNAKDDLKQSGGGFEDADFEGTSLKHLNAWKMNLLINTVIPALSTTADVKLAPDSDVTFRDILYGVKTA